MLEHKLVPQTMNIFVYMFCTTHIVAWQIQHFRV
jgi:hypothetical protein